MIERPSPSTSSIIRRMLRQEDGSTTIEFVLWFPITIFVLILAIQGSLLFMVQANYGHAARDTARLVARHAMSAEDARNRLLNEKAMAGGKADASVEISNDIVSVSISARAVDLSVFNVFGLVDDLVISANIAHQMEPK